MASGRSTRLNRSASHASAHHDAISPPVYATKSESAREGMRLLLAEGVAMRAMRPEDWDFLVSLCNPEVRLMSPDGLTWALMASDCP